MNDLQVFAFNDQMVRTVRKDGEPWWIAKDVCEVLGLSDVSMSVKNLEDDEKGTSIICTLGGPQEMTVINESGLYNLIFRSRKEEARAFRRWVTHEVLPQIRRTGSYGATLQIEALMTRYEGKISKHAMGKLALMAASEITGSKAPTDAAQRFDCPESLAMVTQFLRDVYPERPITVPALTIFNEYQCWLKGRWSYITEKHQLGGCLRRLGMRPKKKWIGNPRKRPKGLGPTVQCYKLIET